MVASNDILLALGQSFKAYLVDVYKELSPKIIIEYYDQPIIDIESRKDIPFARVAFHEGTDNVTDYISSHIANMSNQTYFVTVSVVRAYMKNDHTRGEFPVMHLRDTMLEWAKTTNFSSITNGYIYTFGYAGAQSFQRNDRFVTRTFTFSAIRDLYKPQIA
jgi:hypothetical protein